MAEVVAADGLRLYAEAHGAGIPLVFSCGYCTTHENFRPQVEPLAHAGARVILWDYRGHGRSESPPENSPLSMRTVVADLASVLDWAAPGQAAVVGGLSLGGLVSLHFALAYPARTRALVLIDSGPGFKKPDAQARWTAQIERIAERLEAEGMQAFVESRAAATAIGRRRELSAAQAAARAIAAQDARAVAHFGRCVAGPAPSVIDELPSLAQPALIVVGAEDEAYLQAAEVMAAKLPGARRATIARAGHIVNIEEADAFNAEVARFLAELPAP
ncbi:MAG TPA: alpha/beta hydrolase [Myxococcota bacterium]|nr:alpha/beta hydrolase [Myxococcota bacterium]